MSGIIANRSSSTDVYANCHSIPNPDYATFNTTETDIVKLLTTGKTLSTANDEALQGYEVIKADSTITDQIMPVCYPADTIEQDAVLASVYKNNTVTFESSSTKLSKPSSNNNEVTLSVDNTSTSIYDTVVKVNTSIEPNVSSLDGSVLAIFDSSDNNVAAQYAVNSQYNTKPDIVNMENANVYPTYLQEDVSFNTTKAFGRNYTQYVSSIDSVTGEPIWSNYSNNVPSITDKFILTERTSNDVSYNDGSFNVLDFNKDKDFGIFRVAITLNEEPIKTILKTGPSLNSDELSVVTLAPVSVNNPVSADTHIKNIPLFHETNDLSLSNQNKTVSGPDADDSKFLLPNTSLTLESFKTLIDPLYQSEILPNFEFKIEIDTSANSGYKFNDSQYNLITIDDSELKDSLIYMRDWVNKPHNLSLSNGDLSLTTGTNGLESFINSNRVVLNGGREKLSQTEAGVNGVLQMNSHNFETRHSTSASSNDANMKVNVYYSNDTIPSGLSNLDDALCTEPNVSFGWQKVIETSSLSTTKFKDSSNTTMNLIANNTNVNSSYINDASKFTYTFDHSQLPSNSSSEVVQLWKVKSGINLVSQPSRFNTPSNQDIDNIISDVTLTNATPLFNQTVRELQQYIKVKTPTDLHFNSTLLSNGWTSSLSEKTHLVSSSIAAFQSEDRLPSYIYDFDNFTDPITEYLANSGVDLSYSITYQTVTMSSAASSLGDSFVIKYNYSENHPSDPSAVEFTIPQTDMIITPVEEPIKTTVVVPTSEYSFSTSSVNGVLYTNETHELLENIVIDKYTSTFNMPLGQYTNYMITTPVVIATTKTYTLRKKSDGSTTNSRIILSRITKIGTGTGFYSNAHQELSPVNPSHSLSISGILNKNDLKELLISTQSKNLSNNTWTTISNNVDGTVFYPVEGEPIINDIADNLLPGSANISTTLAYSNEGDLLINEEYYTIPLVMDYKSNVFELKTFTTTLDRNELSNKTSLVSNMADTNLSNKTLDVNNLYSAVNANSWVTPSNYKIVSSIVDNDITIKVVKTDDLSESAVFTIGINDNYIFIGEMLISNIKKDVIRKRETIGSTYTETFMECEPTIPSITMKNGVYVNKVNAGLVIPLGAYQLFSLKKDLFAYNLVGSTLGSSSQISSLGPYQWTSGDLYSDVFTLNRYRGHGHPSTTSSNSVDQYYNIVRPAINATFTITDSSNSTVLSQTFNNIYSGAVFELNNLKRNVSDAYPSDIGLKLTSNFSMPSKVESRNKSINVVGDSVIIRVLNPQAKPTLVYSTPQNADSLNPALYPLNKSLKDYNLFRFTGENSVRYYNGPMKIRSSRVKLRSNNVSNPFTENSMIYSILWDYQANETIVKVTRAKLNAISGNPSLTNVLNFVGNPELIGAGTNTSFAEIDRETHELNLVDAKNIGINVGMHNIKLKSEGIEVVSTTYYYVSAPPYYKYETMGIGNNITIPYNYSEGDFSGNRVVKYMPNIENIKDADGYASPFQNITYNDMTRTQHVVSVDSVNNLVNNMKMKLVDTSVRVNKDLLFNPISEKKFISLFGSKMSVDLYKGEQLLKNVFNDYITSLTNDLSNNMTLVSSNLNSGVKFMIRQPLSVIGYSQNETDSENEAFYNTSDKSKWFPFKFTLTNVNMVRPEMSFNMMAGPGCYPILYTVKNVLSYTDASNSNVQEELYRRVYKYENTTAVDFDSVSLKTTLTFSSRQYVDIPVPSITSGNGFNNNMFNQLLQSIQVGSLTWKNDTDFNDDVGNATFTLLYGNSSTADKFRRDLFYANNGETVFTLINYKPLMVMNNQIGMPLFSILWNGYTKAPQILTEAYNLQPERDSYLVTETKLTSDLAKHTLLKLN